MTENDLFKLFEHIESKIDFAEVIGADEYRCRYEYITREILLENLTLNDASNKAFENIRMHIEKKVKFFTIMDCEDKDKKTIILVSNDKKIKVMLRQKDGFGEFTVEIKPPRNKHSVIQHFIVYEFSTNGTQEYFICEVNKKGETRKILTKDLLK